MSYKVISVSGGGTVKFSKPTSDDPSAPYKSTLDLRNLSD
jgi:hypothetical protein